MMDDEAAVTERAKHHLLDTLAAMLSGLRLLLGRRAIEFAAVQGGAREACVIGSRIVTSAATAALANGMHGLRHHTTAVRGTATNPMPRDEVAAKSRDLLVPVIGSRRTERLINAVWNIERIRDACQLRPLLQV